MAPKRIRSNEKKENAGRAKKQKIEDRIMPPKRVRPSENKEKASRAKKQKVEGRSRVKAIAQLHPNWCQLPTEMQNLVVSKLDNETKRALRATSFHNFRVVNNFRFMNLKVNYSCSLWERTLKNGTKKFLMRQFFDEEFLNEKQTKFQKFQTLEAMIENLRITLNKFDTLLSFGLKIVGFTEPFPLLKNQEKLKVTSLLFNAANEPHVVNGFLNQFDQDLVKNFIVSGENIREDVFSRFKLQHFKASETVFVDDFRLLSIRARCIHVPGKNVTVAGLSQFLDKMLRHDGMSHFVMTGLSQEVIELFHYSRRVRTAEFFINPHRNIFYSVRLELSRIPREPLKLEGDIVDRDDVESNHPNRVGPALQLVFDALEMAP